MSLTVNTNLASMRAANALNKTQSGLSNTLARVSSGLRVTKAADDAAGSAVAMNLSTQARSGRQAMRNANDGISMIQTAEGGLNEIHSILVRMRELSVQASNETYNSTDRSMIATEMTQLKDEYVRITSTANFNRVDVLNGTDTAFHIQVGIHQNNDNRISINMASLNSTLGAVGLSFGSCRSGPGRAFGRSFRPDKSHRGKPQQQQ